MSKAASKRAGDDIAKQTKKIKNIDVSLVVTVGHWTYPASKIWLSSNSLRPQEVLKLVKKLGEQSKHANVTET